MKPRGITKDLLLLTSLLAAAILAGCATQAPMPAAAPVPVPAPPPPPPAPPVEPVPSISPDPCTMTNSVAVIINATSEATIDNTFRKDNEVEVCKGKQSIVWYAENGSDLGITIEPTKSITHGQPRGTFVGQVVCGNVVDSISNAVIASTCTATVKMNSTRGNVAYTLTVTPKSTGTPYPVDPQMIIRP